jgi:flagellar biosynthesis protein FliP
MRWLPATLAALVLAASPALAQEAPGIDPGSLLPNVDATTSGRIIQGIVLITVLSLAPGLLVTATCFTRFVIALSFLRTGLGLQSTPPNIVLVSLALFMTYFAVAPEAERAWNNGVQPILRNEITEEEAVNRMIEPFREFMLVHVRDKDLAVFARLSEARSAQDAPGPATPPVTPPAPAPDGAADPAAQDDVPPLSVLLPAYMVSELRRAFEIGFLIILPFLVIDLIVATITMAMGMMMLPPTVLSLPMKILFFVLIDGWSLIVGSLLDSVL